MDSSCGHATPSVATWIARILLFLNSGQITLGCHPLWHKTKSLHKCWPSPFLFVCSQVKVNLSRGFELKLAELFVSSEAHTDAFKTIFVLENLLFVFSLVSAHFLQVITLKWFAEGDSYRSRPPAQPSSGDWEMAMTPDSHISCLGMSSGK